MPSYLITDNETGRKFKVTGDSPPTEQEMVQIFSDMGGASKEAPITQDQANTIQFPSGSPKNVMGIATPRQRDEAMALREPVVKGTLETAGLMAGGLYGGPLGAGAGYMAGNRFADYLLGQEQPHTYQRAVKDVAVGTTIDLGGRLVGKAISKIAQTKPVRAIIQKGIEKGIRPGLEGNRTFPQQSQYIDKAEEAVKNIIANKGEMTLVDEFGDALPKGSLPKNLKQFSDAIHQTKASIFNRFNQMAEQSGQAGATVDLSGISGELQKVAGNKVLNKMAPGVAKYAEERAGSLVKGRVTDVATGKSESTFTAKEAQEAIAILNNSLEAFYKNPSYDTASKAYIDSLIVNNLRKSLDASIEQLSGPGYQALKKSYGALKAIEKDVNRRALVDARKNVKGLIDFSDIFSGSEVVRGLISMNPASVGQGMTAKFIATLHKMKNDPNRIIEKMFQQAGKHYGDITLPEVLPVEMSPRVVPTPRPRTPLNLQPPAQPSNMRPRTPIGLSAPELPSNTRPRTPLNLQPPAPPNNMLPRTPINLPQGGGSIYDSIIGANRPR